MIHRVTILFMTLAILGSAEALTRYVSAHANGYAPHHGVIGGYDGGYSYHARAVVDGKWVPGKAGAYPNGLLVKAGIPYGGAEHRMQNYEILTSTTTLRYQRMKTGDRPPVNGIVGGYDGGQSYFAKGVIHGHTIPGKAGTDSHGNLVGACFAWGGKEYRINNFWVLLHN